MDNKTDAILSPSSMAQDRNSSREDSAPATPGESLPRMPPSAAFAAVGSDGKYAQSHDENCPSVISSLECTGFLNHLTAAGVLKDTELESVSGENASLDDKSGKPKGNTPKLGNDSMISSITPFRWTLSTQNIDTAKTEDASKNEDVSKNDTREPFTDESIASGSAFRWESSLPLNVRSNAAANNEDASKKGAVDLVREKSEQAVSAKKENNVSELVPGRKLKSNRSSIFVKKDKQEDMTYGRRIALKLIQKQWYYNPEKVEQAEKKRHEDFALECGSINAILNSAPSTKMVQHIRPSLEKAWAYFEHNTLPRYLVENPVSASPPSPTLTYRGKCMGKAVQMDRAEPGENEFPTKLYSPIYTPLSQMGDFGLGVGLYFSTLRALALMTLLAGLINIPNMMYFDSEAYSPYRQDGIKFFTRGSAICTDQTFVPCPDCNEEDFGTNADYRLGYANVNGEILQFALKNNCLAASTQVVMINYGTLFFVLIGFIVLDFYQRKKEVEFDEDEQTCQDYSILIENPPSNAYDAEEWKKFFANFDGAHVTCCTVTVNNNVLLHALAELRERQRQLELQLPTGESLDENHIARISAEIEANLTGIAKAFSFFHAFGLMMNIPALYCRIVVLTARIRGLAQRNYEVTKVFVTFETEAAQRHVLSELSYGKVKVKTNDVTAVSKPEYLFRDNYLLSVREAEEPSTVRWQDLDQSFKTMAKQITMTTIVSLCAMVLLAFAVHICRLRSNVFAAVAISVFNTIFPIFAKAMTNFESHPSESEKQRSLYIKISAFRWVNTAIVMTIITPSTSTITAGKEHLLYSVYAIFFSEVFTSSIIQVLDIGGFVQRHFSAPRAPNQERMNMCFKGTDYDLAERYTAVTKILFLTFSYSTIFPAGFFFCSAALLVNFYIDKFSIMRTWKPAPALGKEIAVFSRKYFFTITVFSFSLFASFMWSGFPYDNLCIDTENTPSGGYIGELTVTPDPSKGIIYDKNVQPISSISVNISETDKIYKYCNQNFYETGKFPALPQFQPPDSKWMTLEQEWATEIYGWTSVAILILLVGIFIWRFFEGITTYFLGGYEPAGRDMNINFSEVKSIDSFIPQINSSHFVNPLIACSLEGIDEGLMSWTDPEKPYEYYSLTKDVDKIFEGTNYSPAPRAFSKVMHWPPSDELS